MHGDPALGIQRAWVDSRVGQQLVRPQKQSGKSASAGQLALTRLRLMIEELENILGWPTNHCLVVRVHNRPLDQNRVARHGLD